MEAWMDAEMEPVDATEMMQLVDFEAFKRSIRKLYCDDVNKGEWELVAYDAPIFYPEDGDAESCLLDESAVAYMESIYDYYGPDEADYNPWLEQEVKLIEAAQK